MVTFLTNFLDPPPYRHDTTAFEVFKHQVIAAILASFLNNNALVSKMEAFTAEFFCRLLSAPAHGPKIQI
jgi:hypothetical protein